MTGPPHGGSTADRKAIEPGEAKILEALGNVGDFIGGLAVVITLLYLAVQIRQNTAALRAAGRQQVASDFRSSTRLFLDPDVGRAYSKGLLAYPDLPFEDRNLFATAIGDHAVFFQGAFALYESGQLEEETYRAYLDWLVFHIATPGGRAWWDELGQPFFPKAMVEAVEARLAEGKIPDITKLNFIRLDD